MTLDDLIDTYCAGWSAEDPAERERLFRRTLSESATYCDPRTPPLRIPALCDYVAGIRAARPGSRVVRTSRVDAHHGFARFHWHVVLADGTKLPEGIDVVRVSADGTKLVEILGFFGPLAPR